ncbi:MAG: hypothetical protein B6D56_04000 [Candidatus Omnitrophica bacterium 4484_70.1]|nr:MAG: hypothetical protein B6D56_04000 [Candidatus Omnitrophica bacterium 4484_70.1]
MRKGRIFQISLTICIYTSVLAGLMILGNRFITQPMERIKKDLQKTQEELAKKEKMIRKVPHPRKKIEEIREKMEDLRKKSVSHRELPRIIQQLTKKSSELGIEIISIKPIEEVSFEEKKLPTGVSKAYIEVVFKASYKETGAYLKALEELPIIFTIEKLSIEKPSSEEILKEEENKLIVTLLISSYTIWKI